MQHGDQANIKIATKEDLKLYGTAEAKAEGKGVAVKEGKFIGPPMLKMAEKILNKRDLIKNEVKNTQKL